MAKSLILKREDLLSAAVLAASARLDGADVPLGRGAAGLLSLTGWHKNSQKEKETGGWSFCRPAAAPARCLHTQSSDVFFFLSMSYWVLIKHTEFLTISGNWLKMVYQSFIDNFGLNFENFGLTLPTTSIHFKHSFFFLCQHLIEVCAAPTGVEVQQRQHCSSNHFLKNKAISKEPQCWNCPDI